MAFEPPPTQATTRSGSRLLALQHLRARLVADHGLEIAHHPRIGMRPRRGADDVERVVDVGDPVAQRLVHRVLQRARTGCHRPHFGAEQLHAEHVRLLPLDIDLAHIDDAGQTEARGDRRGRDAMLARAGLGDDARLAHAAREQDLAEAVVDLVRAGVVEVFALQINLRAAEMLGQALGEIERALAADIVLEHSAEFGLERGIGFRGFVGALQIEHQRHQRLGDEAPAITAEMALRIGTAAPGIGRNAHADVPAVGGGARGGDESRNHLRALDAGRRLDAGRHIDARRIGLHAIARATLSAFNPPASSHGFENFRPRSNCQSNAAP